MLGTWFFSFLICFLEFVFLAVQRQNEQRCEQEIEDLKQGVQSGNITPDTSLIRFSDEALDEQKHCIRISDEKVAMAVSAYDLVDAHIQQLDNYMRRSDEEVRRDKDLEGAAPNLDSSIKPTRGSESSKGGRKKSRVAADPPSMDLDLPVDPNEPTYCFCNQVSYGEMVACDNPDCKIEWFHYGCVGLKEQPKGKWYCSNCTGMQKRRKGK
ncbi:RING/FYVE/PHD zinc finger superfamily protein isoform X2 [Tasmannia lanceolata]|uniref:RING/FYVE/PHD zinc finger superfamily protein isoform X2 n=1 Tax=Tasmannia lanceolata TaxID=3420 RepID=UPI0040631DE5